MDDPTCVEDGCDTTKIFSLARCRRCYDKNRAARRAAGQGRISALPMDVTCACCGETFHGTTDQARAVAFGRNAYCSRACQKRGCSVDVECTGCGVQFRMPQSRLKASRTGRVFHSIECARAHGLKPEDWPHRAVPAVRWRYVDSTGCP